LNTIRDQGHKDKKLRSGLGAMLELLGNCRLQQLTV